MLIEDNWTIYKEEFDALIKRKKVSRWLEEAGPAQFPAGDVVPSALIIPKYGLSSDVDTHSLPVTE